MASALCDETMGNLQKLTCVHGQLYEPTKKFLASADVERAATNHPTSNSTCTLDRLAA